MTDFYDRRFTVDIDGRRLIDDTMQQNDPTGQFKIVFNILIDFGGAISYGDIQIYNLSNDTVSKFIRRGSIVSFNAGYINTIDTLFRGRITNVFKEREGPSRITRIIARGGSQPNRTVNQSLGQNTRLPEIIRALGESLGYAVTIQDSDFSDVASYSGGYLLLGNPRAKLDALAQTHRFNYVIDNDRLIVTARDSFVPGSPVVVSQFTGMEGIPEITEVGCDVKVRINPKIRIGGRIDIQSELSFFNFSNYYFQDIPSNEGQGIYSVFRLRHIGDSKGTQWTTTVTGLR